MIQNQKIVTRTKDEVKIDLNQTIDFTIVLNGKISQNWLKIAVENSKAIILADGGANYFYESPYRDNTSVKCIVGDLDSAKKQVIDYYSNRGVQICKVEDQNYNDFQKSIIKAVQLNFSHCFCLGALGGRLDHTFSAISIMGKYSKLYPNMQFILLGDQDLMIYIKPQTKYTIKVSPLIERAGCGLITFSKAQKIVTKGFRWNMGPEYQFESLQWNNFLSTSNQIQAQQISVYSSHELYFICRLKTN